MPYRDLPHRRSIRLASHDYAGPATYFVTICASERACLFGEVVDGNMVLNDIGRAIEQEWQRTGALRSNVDLDAFVVMPNHFHGIITVRRPTPPVIADRLEAPPVVEAGRSVGASRRLARSATNLAPGSLGAIVAQFKSATTKRVSSMLGESVTLWQRNYYEHIVREAADLARIRDYIANNPASWSEGVENPANRRPVVER